MFNLAWSSTRWTKQPEAGVATSLLKSKTLVTRTEISRPGHHENWKYMIRGWFDATTVFIIGILPISFHRAKKEQLNPPDIKQEISGDRESLLKMGLPLPKYFLFIDVEVKPSRIQNFHICRYDFESWIFRHVRSTGFDSILLHDLLHYEVEICVINYPVVFTGLQRGPRVLKGIDPWDYKRRLQLPEPRHTHSAPLFPLKVGRKRKRREHL